MLTTPGTTAPVSEYIGRYTSEDIRQKISVFGCVRGVAGPHDMAGPHFFMTLLARVSRGSPALAGNGWRHPAKDQRWMWQRGSDAGHCQAGAGACSSWLHHPKMPPDLRQEMCLHTGMQTSRSHSLADRAALDPHLGLTLGLHQRSRES